MRDISKREGEIEEILYLQEIRGISLREEEIKKLVESRISRYWKDAKLEMNNYFTTATQLSYTHNQRSWNNNPNILLNVHIFI